MTTINTQNERQTTREEWIKSFQGATLKLTPTFGSPKVAHAFARNFDLMGRNGFFISVRGRILLSEEQASAAEQHVYDRFDEIMKKLDAKLDACKAIMRDANITTMAEYNKPTQVEATIVSPMQTKYIRLLERADELFSFCNTLMLYGEIPEREYSKREYELKRFMRVLPNVIRSLAIGLRLKLAEKNAGEQHQAGEADSTKKADSDVPDPAPTDAASVAAAEEQAVPQAELAAA